MKIYSILDDMDTAVGFNLSGIHSIVLEDLDIVNKKIDEVMEDNNVGILVVSKNVYEHGKEKLDNIIEKRRTPLVVVIWK